LPKKEGDESKAEREEVNHQQLLGEEIDIQSETYTMIVYDDDEQSSSGSSIDQEATS